MLLGRVDVWSSYYCSWRIFSYSQFSTGSSINLGNKLVILSPCLPLNMHTELYLPPSHLTSNKPNLCSSVVTLTDHHFNDHMKDLLKSSNQVTNKISVDKLKPDHIDPEQPLLLHEPVHRGRPQKKPNPYPTATQVPTPSTPPPPPNPPLHCT